MVSVGKTVGRDMSGVYELRERGSSRRWEFLPLSGDTVRIRLVGCGVLVLGACERWVLKAFTRNRVQVPWNPFGRGYSFLNFRMDCHPIHEAHYCEVQFHKSDGHTVYMDTADARVLWASISGNTDEFQTASRAAQKNRRGQTALLIV